MKTFLIPTDFSSTATNAVMYAARLSQEFKEARLILLNSYYVSIYESILPSPDFVIPSEEEIHAKLKEKEIQLLFLKEIIHPTINSGTRIDIQLSRMPLTQAIAHITETEKIDYIIVGSNGNGAKEESDIGSNAVKISKSSTVPVIVVPPDGKFESITRVVMACDFKKVTETLPLKTLKKILERTSVELLVVNVDPHGKHYQWNPELIVEETALFKMLECFNPKYYYSDKADTISGIIDFAKQYDAQLIIALPKKYSFFQSLIHTSVTKKLTIESSCPYYY